jgi:hypothetical protein
VQHLAAAVEAIDRRDTGVDDATSMPWPAVVGFGLLAMNWRSSDMVMTLPASTLPSISTIDASSVPTAAAPLVGTGGDYQAPS